MERLAYNQTEAAAVLGISEESFVQHVRPNIRRVDLGRRMLFPHGELQRWLDTSAR